MIAEQGKAKTIFFQALEIAAGEERQAFIVSACGNDEALRCEVEELLRHQQELGSFLESPAPGLPSPLRGAPQGTRAPGHRDGGEGAIATRDEPTVRERPGTVIGPYKLLEQIGEGGFGVVFMADQQAPIRRKVALKVLKPGMDTKQVIARFEAERQALALMDHPNIAHVFDGGETATLLRHGAGARHPHHRILRPESHPCA
jgi:serine/threonine protein kinase